MQREHYKTNFKKIIDDYYNYCDGLELMAFFKKYKILTKNINYYD